MGLSDMMCKMGLHSEVVVKGIINVDTERRMYTYFGDCSCGKSWMFEYGRAVQGGDVIVPRKKLERM